jgi:transcriptional/translational regulatory protein YebC/TACO1
MLDFGGVFAGDGIGMAGHSKSANIRHRKAAQDKKRGKIYTRLIREFNLEEAEKIIQLIDVLEELDDVQQVYTNADITDDILAQVSGDV